jgi:hypothetical protein
MYKGLVISESLRNPSILNGVALIRVKVEHHPTIDNDLKTWHDFKVQVGDDAILSFCNQMAKEIKEKWYAHFWNADTLYVVLPGRVFKMPRERNWTSEAYQECKKYAMEHGVEEQYLFFMIED